ncbi:general transcription factor 3C polypeptide 4-like [Dendronephthya gigantea]|uniref:general transcription factor 3C polypeptide 4-like n=1 Tax=Dendronephthya gigantea TaxID=151771 RepID=UPI00106A8578|nr:general transcription factor 3C polypeptide 4-like [Dendronephthya gigantea]
MAGANSKVIQRISVHHRSSNIDGISWSKDNRLAVATNSFVNIINITGVQTDEKKKESKLRIKRSAIAVDNKPKTTDVDFDFSMTRSVPLSAAPYFSTAILDPALTPTILKSACYEDVTYAKWSPVGCDRTGRSVLAVLFRTNKLALYVADKQSPDGWCEIMDLSSRHFDEMKQGSFFKDKMSMKGELPSDFRHKVGNQDMWKEFSEWQRRKYLLNFTCIEWFPTTVDCLQQTTNVWRKFALFSTIVRSGQLFIWQAQLPLVKNHSFMHRTVAAYTSLFYPSCLAWYGDNESNVSYLGCGNADGIIKVFLVKITPTDAGIPGVSIAKAYSFFETPDGISVDCMAWYSKDNKLYLACSKGPHITLFQTQLMKEGALSKPVKQVITGIHLLNVTGIAISPSGMLFSTSAEGSVQQFQIGSRVRSTAMDCETLSGHGYSGVAISPNGVFIALFENKRKLFHYKKNAIDSQGEIAVISLLSKEENVQDLMSNASSVSDVVEIRDRFIHQELSRADLFDTVVLPAVLSNFSQAYLQFLWNLFSSDPKFKKYSAHEAVVLGSCDDLVSENHIELRSLYRVEKIEKQVATLSMEKALESILEYHEAKKTSKKYIPVAGDMTVKCICRWLAQNNSSSSVVVDLLEKVWSITKRITMVNDTEEESCGSNMDSDVCKEILDHNDVFENCMCGQPIRLSEVRFGRCSVGHIWPRCCVTFKLLDGTNARVCENCNAHALNRHPINSPYEEDWTKHLLDVTSSCTYCGAWFEEV